MIILLCLALVFLLALISVVNAQAAAGSNGPLVVDLHPDFSSGSNASGCVAIASTLAHSIQRNPSNYYILVTSINHPDGAVRAQLVK
jgi:hypothetical protein